MDRYLVFYKLEKKSDLCANNITNNPQMICLDAKNESHAERVLRDIYSKPPLRYFWRVTRVLKTEKL